MALVTCPECGNEKVASSAESCPACGNTCWLIVVRREECVCYMCNGIGTARTILSGPVGYVGSEPCGICQGKKRVIASLMRNVKTGHEYHALGEPIP